jgi:transcriptional regulator with XRE-family HTH domain
MGLRLNLKTAILATGKSQRQFAADHGFSENRISELVRGWAEPTDEEARKIARATRKPVADLFDSQQVA